MVEMAVWKLYDLSGFIEFSHVVAVLIFLWYSKRQPRYSSSCDYPTKKKKKQSTAQPTTRSHTTITTDTASNANSTTDNPEAATTAALHDPLWQIKVPQATLAERTRFYRRHQQNITVAATKCQEYCLWREKHAQLERDVVPTLPLQKYQEDAQDWLVASSVAMAATGCRPGTQPMPQMGRMHILQNDYLRDKDGHRIVCVTPGRMDERIVPLPTYSLAFALYLDRKVQRESLETISILVDVRSGQGWRNLNGAQLVSFIKHTLVLLIAMFPERLARAVVYPVPPSFMWVWTVVRTCCLDAATAQKIVLCTGPATMHSPPPTGQLHGWGDPAVATALEDARTAMLVRTK